MGRSAGSRSPCASRRCFCPHQAMAAEGEAGDQSVELGLGWLGWGGARRPWPVAGLRTEYCSPRKEGSAEDTTRSHRILGHPSWGTARCKANGRQSDGEAAAWRRICPPSYAADSWRSWDQISYHRSSREPSPTLARGRAVPWALTVASFRR